MFLFNVVISSIDSALFSVGANDFNNDGIQLGLSSSIGPGETRVSKFESQSRPYKILRCLLKVAMAVTKKMFLLL